MSYAIRQRPSVLVRHIRDVLRAGLEAQVDAINADLVADEAPYRLPPYGDSGDLWGDSHVLVRAQGPELPEGLTYPHVRVVPQDTESRQDASSRSGITSLGLLVVCYLDTASLNASKAAAPALVLTDDATEQELVLALLDLANACARVLRDPASGALGGEAGGVRIAVDRASAPRLHQVPAPDYRASAALVALEVRVEQEETY